MDTLFSISNILVMPFWFLMIFLPFWRWTQRVLQSPWVAAAAALLYSILVIPRFAELLPLLMSPSQASIATLLGTPAGATIAWVHFLAFDLFVGRWIYLDSRERGITAWLISPVLFLTLMFGPFGFLAYLLLRAGYTFARMRNVETAGA